MTVTPVTGTGTSAGVNITWQGGSDINSLTGLAYSVDGSASTTLAGFTTPTVGQTTNVPCSDPSGKRIVLVGTFTDGSDQVIFDKRF